MGELAIQKRQGLRHLLLFVRGKLGGQVFQGGADFGLGDRVVFFLAKHGKHAILNRLEIRLARFWPTRDGLSQL